MLSAQDIRVYSGNNFSGNLLASLNVGQSALVNFIGCNGSVQILSANVAVELEIPNPPAPYPFMKMYSERSFRNIEPGTDQYCGRQLRVRCLPAAQTAANMPQPTAWIPIDRNNFNGGVPALPNIGDRALMLKRAFIWENSEDLGCCHGPYASIALGVYESALLTNFNHDFDAIAQIYQEPLPGYTLLGGVKLPGQIYSADNPCNDFWSGCFGAPDDPKGEWIDGPWGACYSRVPVFIWPAHLNQVSVILREGDDTNNDDFMGGILVDKANNNPIIFKAWNFGWLEFQNVTITQEHLNENVDVSDLYWFHNWNGANPSSIHSIPQTPPYDQFLPLPGSSIPQMEAAFPANSTIGLLGGQFPAGTLRKPMTYKAPCQPATFH